MTNLSASHPAPDWALQHARAALQVGMRVPQIEKLLIARGLDPAMAAAVAEKAIEERVREELQGPLRAQWRLRLHRILSGVIALAYLVLGYWARGPEGVARVALGISLALACIWFGDAMGSARGPVGLARPWITAATPGVMVRLGGWLLLLLPIIVVLSRTLVSR
jgi:hypothetical protein